MFDILVIGAGAAGYMAAIIAKRENPELKIAILEKTGKVLGKVKISGGGRCNLTHNCLKISELSKAYPRGGRFLKKCFPLWSVQETLDFFNGLGVETYAQEDGRMFPTSNTSETVVDALQNEAKGIGIKVILNQGLNGLEPTDNGWTANTRDQEMTAKSIILAMGGFPKEHEYNFLKNLDVQIAEPVPSLFTFNIADYYLHELAGVSVPEAWVKIDGLKEWHIGACLVTHWGLSGPAILRSSAVHALELNKKRYNFTVRVNWLAKTEAEYDEIWAELNKTDGAKNIKNINMGDIPQRLWEYILVKTGMTMDTNLAEVSRADKNRLKENLLQMPFEVKGKTTFKEEFVTAGGIELSEINKQMQIIAHPGLYACGEIFNIDGITGGYNFQAAWTTGYLAGLNAAGYCK